MKGRKRILQNTRSLMLNLSFRRRGHFPNQPLRMGERGFTQIKTCFCFGSDGTARTRFPYWKLWQTKSAFSQGRKRKKTAVTIQLSNKTLFPHPKSIAFSQLIRLVSWLIAYGRSRRKPPSQNEWYTVPMASGFLFANYSNGCCAGFSPGFPILPHFCGHRIMYSVFVPILTQTSNSFYKNFISFSKNLYLTGQIAKLLKVFSVFSKEWSMNFEKQLFFFHQASITLVRQKLLISSFK